MATVLQHQNNVATNNFTGESEEAQMIAKLIDMSHDKKSLSPPKQDFLLDCVHYSNNKKEINLVTDKIQRIINPGVKENTPMVSSYISTAQEGKKLEARTSFPNKKKGEQSSRQEEPLFESDKLIVEDFFKQMKNKEKNLRDEINSLLNKEESFKDKYPAMSYSKLFDNYNRRALPRLNHKFEDPVRLNPATEYKLRQATFQNRYFKSGFGNMELSDILKLNPFNDYSANDISKFSNNIPEENEENSKELSETKTPSSNPSTIDDNKFKFLEIYSKTFRKQSAPLVNNSNSNSGSNNNNNKSVLSAKSSEKKTPAAIYPVKPKVTRHESVDSAAVKNRSRLRSSPSPIVNHENMASPKELISSKTDQSRSDITPKHVTVKSNIAPRYMSEIKARPVKDPDISNPNNTSAGNNSFQNNSFDGKKAAKVVVTKTFRTVKNNNKKEFSSTGPIKNPTSLTSPTFPKQKSGPEIKQKDIVPIKESRESSEVSIQPEFGNQEKSKVNASRSSDIKEDLTECKEEAHEEDSLTQKKSTISKRSLTNKGSKPKTGNQNGTIGTVNPNTMYATESYEKTLTSPLMSYGPGVDSASRKSSRYMNIQDNFDGFEPNVDIKVPANKDEFYECTSLTKISHYPEDSSLSKNNSHVMKGDSSIENGVSMNIASNYIDQPSTSQENSAVRNINNKKEVGNSSEYYTFTSREKIITYDATKDEKSMMNSAKGFQKKSPEKKSSNIRSSGSNALQRSGEKTSPEKSPKKKLLDHIPQEIRSSNASSTKKPPANQLTSSDSDYDFYDPDFVQEVKLTKKSDKNDTFEESHKGQDKKDEMENPLRYTFNPHEYFNEKFDSLSDQ